MAVICIQKPLVTDSEVVNQIVSEYKAKYSPATRSSAMTRKSVGDFRASHTTSDGGDILKHAEHCEADYIQSASIEEDTASTVDVDSRRCSLTGFVRKSDDAQSH